MTKQPDPTPTSITVRFQVTRCPNHPDAVPNMPAATCSVCGQQLQVQVGTIPPACDGSSTCPAPRHTHGCYADHDGSTCDDPADHLV